MEQLEILKWRESQSLASDDAALAEAFSARAIEVHAQVRFLLGAGLSEGASAALSTLAEEDMVDFCILVDLASCVDIAGTAPLDEQTRRHLAEFLDQEPWRSLAVDNDITVTLAMLEDLLVKSDQAPWYRISPQLPVTLAKLMDRVNREQFTRFAAELEARLQRHPDQTLDGLAIVRESVRTGARRVGAPPP